MVHYDKTPMKTKDGKTRYYYTKTTRNGTVRITKEVFEKTQLKQRGGLYQKECFGLIVIPLIKYGNRGRDETLHNKCAVIVAEDDIENRLYLMYNREAFNVDINTDFTIPINSDENNALKTAINNVLKKYKYNNINVSSNNTTIIDPGDRLRQTPLNTHVPFLVVFIYLDNIVNNGIVKGVDLKNLTDKKPTSTRSSAFNYTCSSFRDGAVKDVTYDASNLLDLFIFDFNNQIELTDISGNSNFKESKSGISLFPIKTQIYT